MCEIAISRVPSSPERRPVRLAPGSTRLPRPGVSSTFGTKKGIPDPFAKRRIPWQPTQVVNRRQIAKQLGILFCGLLLFYVASIGPAFAINLRHFTSAHEYHETQRRLYHIYRPIIWLGSKSPTVGLALVAYIDWCCGDAKTPPVMEPE